VVKMNGPGNESSVVRRSPGIGTEVHMARMFLLLNVSRQQRLWQM
jgi:hypothetical protein